MNTTSNLLVADCGVDNSVIEEIANACNQLKENYSLLEKAKHPMKGSPTYAGLNMSTYCKYTKSLQEFTHDEIVDATMFALLTDKITFKDVEMCYKQVEAQHKEDRAIESQKARDKRKKEQDHINLVNYAFDIVNYCFPNLSTEEKRTELEYDIINGVENGKYDRDYINRCGKEASKRNFERRMANSFARELEAQEQQQAQEEQEEIQEPLKEDKTNNILLFRSNPIKWIDIIRYKTTEIENAFIEDVEIEEKYNGKNHLIYYDEKEYTQDKFFETYFERYREVKKRIRFNTDALNALTNISTNQCEKLQYHILAQYFDLVEVDEQDEWELRNFAFYYDSSFKRLYNRINWEYGLSKMITFGAGLQVIGRGKVEKMYCYRQHLEHDKAEYIAVNMTWETWSIAIIEIAEKKQIDESIKAMYYQDEIYMTWTAEERKAVEHWIRTYKSGAVFPYSGEIEKGDNFTIVFDHDCEIVDNIRTRETRAQYNKEHAAELAAARGKIKHSKAAINDYNRLIGDEWTTKELLELLDNNNKKIKRLVDKGLIENIRRGYYRRCKN